MVAVSLMVAASRKTITSPMLTASFVPSLDHHTPDGPVSLLLHMPIWPTWAALACEMATCGMAMAEPVAWDVG